MAHGNRLSPPRPRLTTRLALATTAAALAAAGCSATAAGPGYAAAGPGYAAAGTAAAVPARATAPGTAGAGAVTQALARQVFSGYLATADQAARTGDGQLTLSAVTGVQRSVLAAVLSAHPVTVTGSPPSYRNPVFYLPEAAGYPRFFAARVTRTADAAGTRTTTVLGGATVPASGTALMLFEQAAAGARWLLASVCQLAAGASVPKLATDSSGRVPAAPAAAALLAPPGSVGALQAAVVDDGPASAASRAVAAGPLTTGMYQGAADHADGLRTPRGDDYQWQLDGTGLPVFALRTAGGGALTFYAMSLTETVAVPDVIRHADPVRSGLPIQVPASLLPLLPAGQQAPLVQLQSQQLLSFAAIDPPGAAGKIAVIAIGGGLIAASAT